MKLKVSEMKLNRIFRETFFITVIFIIINIVLASQNDKFNPDKFLKDVQQHYKNLEDFVIEFTKEISSPVIKGGQISKGKLYFLNKNRYRLEIDGQLIISDGETIYNYSKKAKRVVITKFEKNFFSAENLLTNFPQNFRSEFLSEEKLGNKNVFKFRLLPASSNPEFKLMYLWISQEKIIQKIQVEDWAGNIYYFSILSFNSNQKLKDDLIKFKIPSGVKVVDLR